MTDRLALDERANQGTQAQVFATAAETGLPAETVQRMVAHAERQNLLMESLGTQFQQAQDAQTR